VIADGFHWLTTKELENAIAMRQIKPVPAILTATFIRNKVSDFLGACVATFAIFFFVFILLIKYKVNVLYMIPLSGIAGILLY
jgi:chromate transport protein ChrA